MRTQDLGVIIRKKMGGTKKREELKEKGQKKDALASSMNQIIGWISASVFCF